MVYECAKCGKTYESPVRVVTVSHVCPRSEAGKPRVVAMKARVAP